MKNRILLLCTICFLLFLSIPEVMADPGVEKLLPKSPGVVGWQLVGDYYHYLPDNLYNYINGAADLFVSYGFVKLAGAEYAPGSGMQENAIIDIYDMENKLNAFGVFQSKRDPESKSHTIGSGAFGSERYVFFYKDRYYVEIQAYLSASKEKGIPVKLARKVAEGISGDCTPPSELKYLPETGLVSGSEIYITGGILGHAFLDRGMMGDYRIGDEVVKAFVAFFPSGEQAVIALNLYKDFLKKAGEKCQVLSGFGENGFAAKEPYHKNILVSQQGSFVVGVTDLSQAQKGEELLRSLLRTIKKPT
jgi:hypothetical protein